MSKLTVMGIDPGFASVGVAVLEESKVQAKITVLRVLKTEKGSKKELRTLRMSADDSRRLQELWQHLSTLVRAYKPRALAVEAYSPFTGRGGGNAWKTSMVYGLVHGLGLAFDIPVFPFLPADLKRKFGMKASATKQDVADGLATFVPSVREALERLNKTDREHASDAAGHAYLAYAEVQKMRSLLGDG